ncbi:RNA-binding S4 domain-containing protein [Brevibacterium samyangense]|uniref:RNA-binding S4 domain-containing protein n=1 Tax=Brevibacterium samyangense TaxID=366888 RepID=A0ABN2TCB5_9MICO
MAATVITEPGYTQRIDVWLWTVRMFKTRSAATSAVRGGHIRVDGNPVKAAQKLSLGQEVRIRKPGFEKILKVRGFLATRGGAPLAVQCYEDLTPAPDPVLRAPVPRRDKGTGRPTKKDRRALDRLRGRE